MHVKHKAPEFYSYLLEILKNNSICFLANATLKKQETYRIKIRSIINKSDKLVFKHTLQKYKYYR